MLKRALVYFGIMAAAVLYSSCEHEPIQIGKTGNGGNGNNNNTDTGNCNPDSVYFVNDILPMMTAYCTNGANQVDCHNNNYAYEGVRLNTYAGVLKTVKKGNYLSSDIYQQVNSGKMPYQSSKLSADQINLIKKWIMQGAPNNACNPGCDTTKFTYQADIAPIILNNCGSAACHGTGARVLVDYNGIKPFATDGTLIGAITHTVGYKPMPTAVSTLSNCQITKIKKWVNNGAPNN